jgi:hypothetical protein
MKHLAILILIACLLAACAPSPAQIATPVAATVQSIPTQTALPSLTPLATYTLYPTATAYPTYTPVPTLPPLIVTATSSPTPESTPTITNTPKPTRDPLKLDVNDGFYLIGVDIAPGVWRSNGTGDSCYWAITSKTGDILSNHFGMSGGTAYIPANGFQVEFSDCGIWTYIGE